MRRLGVSNALFVFLFAVVFPVYPVFGAILYNISGGIQNFTIDTSSIMQDEFDQEDSQFISADVPLEMGHDWSGRRESIIYTIQEGDTLGQLARDFGVSRDTIRWINNLPSNTLRIGQNLVIPPGNGYVYIVQDSDTLESIARKYMTTLDEMTKNNPHISNGIKTGFLVYFPGMKAPVVTPTSAQQSDEETSLESSLTYKLQLINPKGK